MTADMVPQKASLIRPPEDRIEHAKEILRTLRDCRTRLNGLNLDHAAAYADIAVQLLKQSIAIEEKGPHAH
jgi:type II secretory pathway component PulM